MKNLKKHIKATRKELEDSFIIPSTSEQLEGCISALDNIFLIEDELGNRSGFIIELSDFIRDYLKELEKNLLN